MARSPLTETYKRVQGMIAYVRENLNPGEYDLFLDMVDPQPEAEAPAKKTRKKRAAKSTHAESLSAAIAKTPKGEASTGFCGAILPTEDRTCGAPPDDALHNPELQYANSHPFKPARSAGKKSSRKGAVTNSTPNSEGETASAMSASNGGN